MTYSLDSVKSTIKDHPSETVAAVAVIATLAVIFHYKSKEKKAAVRRKHCVCPPPSTWWSRYLTYRETKHLTRALALAA